MAYRDRYQLSPLCIRAYLRSPVCSDRFLPLDGILLYQAHREQDGPQDYTLAGAYTGQSISTLPLGIIRPGRKDWFYQCSWAQWPEHTVEGIDHWNKRFDAGFADLVDFDGKRGKVIIEQGRYKAYHSTLFYRSALWVEWYCVGDKQAIEPLLSIVTHLGKKAAQGWGRVSRWEIAPVADDYSVWYGDALMRGIPPQDAGPTHPTGVYGIRPSYWNRANQMLLALPGGLP